MPWPPPGGPRDSREPVTQARLDAAWPDPRPARPRLGRPGRRRPGRPPARRPLRPPGLNPHGLALSAPRSNLSHWPQAGRRGYRVLSVTGRILFVCGWMRTVTKRMAMSRRIDDATRGTTRRWDLGADRVYWRRRFFILCGGVVALGVCAWLFPGAHPPSARRGRRRAPVGGGADKRQVPALGRLRQRVAERRRQGGAARRRASARPLPRRSRADEAQSGHRPQPAEPAGARGGHGARARRLTSCSACSPASPATREGARPTFSVYAVSTSAAACTLPLRRRLGPGGRDAATGTWCGTRRRASPAPADAGPVHARRPAGADADLESARRRRPSGCAGSLPAGASGTFDAVAMSDGQSSPVRAFKLGRLIRGRRPSAPRARPPPR